MDITERSTNQITGEKTDWFIVTVCEISDREEYFLRDWIDLNLHLKKSNPTLLLVPDLAFFEWTGYELLSRKSELKASLENQAFWISKLATLHVEYIFYSKLIVEGERYFKASCLYDKKSGHQIVRKVEIIKQKDNAYSLKSPRSTNECILIEIEFYKIGIALDTELWTTAIGDYLGKSGIDILLCPRASSKESVEQWIRQGQTMAVLSGAFCLSSNKTRLSRNNFQWGGRAFITEPFTGMLLGSTNNYKRFLTLKLDMKKSREAKSKFPLKSYVPNF